MSRGSRTRALLYTASLSRFVFHSIQSPHCVGCLTDIRLRQNEPENSNDSYPTCLTSASQEAQIGTALRSLLNNSGFSSVKIIAYDHNWDDAGGYPIQVVRS